MKKLVLLSLVLIASSCAFAQGTVSHIRYGATLPSACSPSTGDVFFKTGTGVGLYACVATNTWGSPATGTVTATSMTTDCVVTASGASSIQTNTSCPTTDSSGNVVAQGSMTIGAGGSASGQILWTDQVSTPSAPSSGKTLFYTKGGKPCSETSSGVETCAGTGAGSVTSVALTLPSWLSVSGSPVTSSGTFAVTATTGQTANWFLAAPNGSTGALAPRAIVAADVPTLNQNTTGTAANLSGTPALPNGTTATTQTSSDNSTKLATTAYVDSAVTGGGGGGSGFANSVANYSAVGNGTTDNSTPFTNACAANNVIYLPAGAYAFTSNYTITCAVEFGAGATIVAPTGVTVTFSGKITASPVTIFTIAGTGKIALAPANTVDYPEWWGALGDNSHDDTAAIQAALNAFSVSGSFANPYYYTGGGITKLRASSYKTTSTLTILQSQVGIEGVSEIASLIQITSASANVLEINSSSCSTTQVGNSVRHVGISRSVSPTGTASGIAVWCALRLTLDQDGATDHIRGFYLNGVGSGGVGFIAHNNVGYYHSGAGTYYGFYIDGSSRQNPSLRMQFNNVANPIGASLHIYGTYITGANLNDLMEYGGETAGVDYGVYVDGTSVSGAIGASDIHFSHDVHDQYTVSAYYVTNLPASHGATMEISEPWIGSTVAANPAIDLENADLVHIIGGTYAHVGGDVFKISGGAGNSIVGTSVNQVQVFGNPSGAILYVASSDRNTVTGNNWYMPSGNTQNFATLTGSSRNVFAGNVLSGTTSGAGFSLDSTSNNNLMLPNSIDPTNIATPYSDAGTGNTWSVGIANPMTTAGDLIIGGSSGTPTRLAAGSTSGYVLTSNGAGVAPSYQAVSATGGVTTLNSLAGALSIVAGTNITVTPSGTNITIAATGGGGSGQTLSPGVPDSGTIPDLSTWTAVNSAVLTSQHGGAGNPALIKIANNASVNWRAFKTTLPSAPYSVIVRLPGVRAFMPSSTFGLYWFDSSNKMAGIELLYQTPTTSNNIPFFRVHKGTSPTVDSSDTPTAPGGTDGNVYYCLAQDSSSTNQLYYYSTDGDNWVLLLTEATGTFMTPTGIGVGGADVATGTDYYTSLAYYRTTTNSTCQ